MRSAEEVLEAQDHDPEMLDYGMTIEAMKQYAKEAIEECARKAVTKKILIISAKCKSGKCRPPIPVTVVDTQSILSLINELK